MAISGRNNQRDERYTVAIIREFWCIRVGKARCQDLSSCRTSVVIPQQTRSKTGPGLGKAKGFLETCVPVGDISDVSLEDLHWMKPEIPLIMRL